MATGAARVAAAVAGSGVLGVFSLDQYIRKEYGDDAMDRLITAYRRAIPAFAAYRFVQYQKEKVPAALQEFLSGVHPELPDRLGVKPQPQEASKLYKELHLDWAQPTYDTFVQLRGFYIKIGQMIANNIGDASPEIWRKTFEPLLDKVPHKPFPQAKATIEAELGKKLDDIFESFEAEPIAAASIGQVHRAVLRADPALPAGTPQAVVVKVMYPEVEGQFRGDVSTAKAFVRVALPEHLPALNEIEKQFASEFDYRREAQQLGEVHDNLRKSKPHFDHIMVPRPILPLCTKAVLVMEEIPHAEKLSDALRRDMIDFAAMKGVELDVLKEEEDRLNREALARGELRCGPSAADMDKLIAARKMRNWTMAPLIALGLAKPVHVPLNHARLVDELLSVHGHEIFIDGAFNGDPHPGNCLLSHPDASKEGGNAKLALVDYGQVKRLSVPQRLALARLIVALAKVNEPGITAEQVASRKAIAVSIMSGMGFSTIKNDPYVLHESAKLYFDRDDKVSTRGMHVQEFVEHLSSIDPVKEINDDYVLVGRAALMLRGLGHALNQHRSTADAWLPYARKLLQDNGEDPDAPFKDVVPQKMS